MTLRDKLIVLRDKAGISQMTLAEQLGVSRQAISRWEIGATYPDIEMLPMIASFFETSVDSLLGVTEEEKEKRKCVVNGEETTALIFSRKHLSGLYLQCLVHRKEAMQHMGQLEGLSEMCNRIYRLEDVDVLFQCMLLDQMDWEDGKLYGHFSTVYLLKKKEDN